MSPPTPNGPDAPDNRSHFRTTRWSVVHAAAGPNSGDAHEALTTLCDSYWYPVYAFLRRSGQEAEDARDLTQGFFARLLEKRDIGSADPVHGKFRDYLLGAVKHFLANERARERALKRGGGRALLSIDYQDADRQYSLEPADPATPEKLFLRNWALALLLRATERLGEEYGAQGKRVVFERLRPMLTGETEAARRREIAESLEMTENALNVAAHRLRRRFRHQLREEIADTLADPDETENELRAMLAILTE
jgi:DNA-directed RNA polymerase specialized sigma24 family protein